MSTTWSDELAEASQTAALSAADRVDYRLNYGRTDHPRECHSSGITGPDIPDAWSGRGGQPVRYSSGDWENPDHPYTASEDDHIAAWFESAIREAVHEAMEWFWVDGAIYLNPHGDHEGDVHRLSGEFAKRLLALRHERAS